MKNLDDKQKQQIKSLEAKLKASGEVNNRLNEALSSVETEKRATRNYNFVQVYKSELMLLRGLIDLSPQSAKILLLMVEKMNKQNAIMIPQDSLQKVFGLKSRSTITKAISVLKKQRWIDVKKVGSMNIYRVNSTAFWQSNAQTKGHVSCFEASLKNCDEEGKKVYDENWKGIKIKSLPVLLD